MFFFISFDVSLTISINFRKEHFFVKSTLENEILEDNLNIFRLEGDLKFFKAVVRSPWVSLLMLESKLVQIPVISYFPGWGEV